MTQDGKLKILIADLSENSINDRTSQSIPFTDLGCLDVPEGYEPDDIKNIVQALGKLIVKIVVTETSPRRPDVYPGTTVQYPKGSITGTGRIDFVKFKGASPGTRMAEDDNDRIKIVTSTSAVFDQSEAQHTTCILNYDTETSDVIVLSCQEVVADVESGRCEIFCAIDDPDVAQQLVREIYAFTRLHDSTRIKYNTRTQQNLVLTVSHPDGLPKHVSIGSQYKQQTQYTTSGITNSIYVYRLNLGNGCCGAPIYRPEKFTAMSLHPHSYMDGSVGVSAVEYEKI
ncbi:unnamed protein product [Lymnaea stagnalis]|uniref:Uncharacterized protein n=1 Tax=Lymnaea stagnalis TaxID=6523 RepID=A0AAV2HGQ2_LYMST